MKIYRIYKILFNPYKYFLKLLLVLRKQWINNKCNSYYDVFQYEEKHDFSYTKLKARLHLNYKIDLKDPKTFNEKLIHRRLFSRDPVWPVVTNKIAVRTWLKESGYLEHVNLVGATEAYSVQELMERPIDKPVVVKAAWASGMNLFVSSKEELQQYDLTLNKWVNDSYYPDRLVWAPEEMERFFLIEDSIADESGKVPLDYKFHCFGGKVEFFQVDIDRFEDHKRLNFSRDGELFDWVYGKKRSSEIFNLDRKLAKEMVIIAERIAKQFSYIRVDLYFFNGEIYFSELTQTQGAGFEQFSEPSLNSIYGEKWAYPDPNKLGDYLLPSYRL